MKKIIILISVTMLGLLLITGCGKKEETVKSDSSSNTSEGVIKDQTVEGLTLTNTSLVTTNGQSTLVTLVSNKGATAKTVKTFNITVKDAKGNVLVTMEGYVGGEVPANGSRTITSTTEADLTKATTVEYSINK